jgi:MinD-like ATPase involved in chromosome partitioning or flagellar assembly
VNPKNNVDPDDDDSLGVLDDTPSSDTTGIGLVGGTAHVEVVLPSGEDDLDDEVVDDEVVSAPVVTDLVIDTSAVADAETLARIQQEAPDVIIELPAADLPAPTADSADQVDDVAETPEGAELVAEIVEDDDIVEDDELTHDVDAEPEPAPTPAVEVLAHVHPDSDDEPEAASASHAPALDEISVENAADVVLDDAADDVLDDAADDVLDDAADDVLDDETESDHVHDDDDDDDDGLTPELESAPIDPPRPDRPAEENAAVASHDPAPAARPAPERPAEIALSSKRLDDLGSASSSETADLLTADRLLDPSRVARPEPEGTWSHLLYSITGGRINVGDSRKARERKQLSARISAPLTGSARFVPVLSRKGGVGKTTVTALLGMALADARDDRVIAVDANPDRGTLAERVVGSHAKSVRDLVRAQHDIRGFHDVSALVARDETRLDVLASDADPRVSEAFGDSDYRDVATVAAQYYSLVLTDSGTGIVHSVMGATLDLADQLVIVSGLSVDEARLASETLTWLETNGHAALARNAIVVLNQSTPGAPLVRLDELEAHFSTRAEHVLRIPYDPQIAGGGAIDFASLQPATRQAAREIAATLIGGLRAKAA